MKYGIIQLKSLSLRVFLVKSEMNFVHDPMKFQRYQELIFNLILISINTVMLG